MTWAGLSPPYATIVADPPWMYTKDPGKFGGDGPWPEHRYSTMPNAEIAALPVAEIAAENAHLYLWTTNVMLTRQRWGTPDPVDICIAWGFEPKTIITWIKTGPPGLGRFYRGNTEHLIFGVRGNLPIPPSIREQNIVVAARGRHSQKPAALYDMVERVSPGPYVDLFARQTRFGWDSWGHGYEELPHGQTASGP